MTNKEIIEAALGRYTENFNETEVQSELDEVYRKAEAWEALRNSLNNGIEDLSKIEESEIRNNTMHAFKAVLITMNKAESEDE